ncbi:expressed unknown protein [Seminavis robusta]|uniref:Microsomal glutathione S-transferase 1 n=1 Tax=Seminavis robusta TaxID=568900 RepID=A0A9N8HEW4_9STRA|nr:expressed unknown protein [Seminavis robusta]|eukprot:Sro404_g135990.1 n/a (177) ;mRNA; r:55577-56223
MAVDMDTYMKTWAWASAVLVMKMMITHLLVVRVRIANELKGKFGEEETTPEAQLDQWHGRWLYPILYYSMGSFAGPYRTMNDMVRFQCMARNACENEAQFLLVAYAWTLVDEMPDWAPQALVIFVYSRILHFVIYAFVRIQPWRAVVWTVGVVINMAIAGNILMQVPMGGVTKSEL